MDEDPIPNKIILLVLIICGLIFPRAAYDSFAFSRPPCTTCAWDYGTLKAPVLLHTEKRRPVKRVKYYGNGTCVPYARARTGIQLYGWARHFLDRAEDNGYSTSTNPVIGGMVITTEGRGHVAVVEDVGTFTISISEQNFTGRYQISERTLDKDDPRILGYIY